ncbi:MAG: polyhydroxyalkanoate synthesis repressor PhaR [Alphaproteobacteria bacterium]|nr:polyhydroxyalkanoate synthesis repressor PhaR [Alphaproteobacteria bacterium]
MANGNGRSEETVASAPVVIKKYANRRLYNTDTSSYVTLEHLSEMVREGTDFVVRDAKTDEDLTRSVLTQIIFEQENRGGQTLLPIQFLRRLIRFYGDQMQSFVPSYLEMSMETFARHQEQLREQMTRAFGGRTPMAAFEEQARQNMAMFEQALRMWSPFAQGGVPPVAPAKPDAKPDAKPGEAKRDDAAREEAVETLRKQMDQMQKQLDLLSGGTRKP